MSLGQPEPEVVREVRQSVETMLLALAKSYEKPMQEAGRIPDPERRHQRMQQLRHDYHELAYRLQKPLRDVIALTPPPAILIEDPAGMTGE